MNEQCLIDTVETLCTKYDVHKVLTTNIMVEGLVMSIVFVVILALAIFSAMIMAQNVKESLNHHDRGETQLYAATLMAAILIGIMAFIGLANSIHMVVSPEFHLILEIYGGGW